MSTRPKVEAIIAFIAKDSSKNWVQDQWILRSTIRSLLAIEDDFLSITIVGHDFPLFLRGLKRVRLVPVDHAPPKQNDQKAKLGDSGVKYMRGLQDAYTRKSSWVFFMNADDLVSRNIPQTAKLDAYDAVIIGHGYSWRTGSRWLWRLPEFHRVCGSCNFIRCEEKMFPTWLGGKEGGRLGDSNHNKVLDNMLQAGFRVHVPRRRLAIYRLGTHNNYWQPKQGNLLSKIRTMTKFCLRAAPISKKLIDEFSIPFYDKPQSREPKQI